MEKEIKKENVNVATKAEESSVNSSLTPIYELPVDELRLLPRCNVTVIIPNDKMLLRSGYLKYNAKIDLSQYVSVMVDLKQTKFMYLCESRGIDPANLNKKFDYVGVYRLVKGLRGDFTEYFYVEIYLTQKVIIRVFLDYDRVYFLRKSKTVKEVFNDKKQNELGLSFDSLLDNVDVGK